MFDIKWIRSHPDAFDEGLAKRGLEPQAERLIDLDAKRRVLQTSAQNIQTERNKLSKEIGAAKARGEDAQAIIDQVSASKETQAKAEQAAAQASE